MKYFLYNVHVSTVHVYMVCASVCTCVHVFVCKCVL